MGLLHTSIQLLLLIIIIVIILVMIKQQRNRRNFKKTENSENPENPENLKTGAAESPSLDKEYLRWTTVMKLKNIFEKLNPNKKKQYESLNILERFLLNSANHKTKSKKDAIFVNPKDKSCKYLFENMRSELKNKHIASDKEIKDVLTSVSNIIAEFLRSPLSHSEEKPSIVNKDTIVFKDFRLTLSKKRLDILFSKFSDIHSDSENALDYIAAMVIRYQCILPRGQHWNIPGAWYKNMYDNYNVRIEGFASPINSQLLEVEYSTQNPESPVSFCSLFYDTDKYFGSLGSAFDLKPADVEGKSLTMNPPYVLEIMDNTSELIQKLLSNSKTRIVFNVPDWTDTEYYSRSMDSKYLKFEAKLEPGKHYHENTNYPDKPAIVAKFPSHVFVFDSRDNGDGDYSQILSGFVTE